MQEPVKKPPVKRKNPRAKTAPSPAQESILIVPLPDVKTEPIAVPMDVPAIILADRKKEIALEAETEVATELIAPHEWDSLLDSFENDSHATPATIGTPAEAGDDLWERLSSTRWIKESTRREGSNSSTVAQPSVSGE